MIKDHVIVTILYLNAFYREKGQNDWLHINYTVTTVIVETLFSLYKQSPVFIAFHKASTASKSTSWSGDPSMAMIISLNILEIVDYKVDL